MPCKDALLTLLLQEEQTAGAALQQGHTDRSAEDEQSSVRSGRHLIGSTDHTGHLLIISWAALAPQDLQPLLRLALSLASLACLRAW